MLYKVENVELVRGEKRRLKTTHQRGSFAPLCLKLCHVEVAGEEQTSLDEFRTCSNVFNVLVGGFNPFEKY